MHSRPQSIEPPLSGYASYRQRHEGISTETKAFHHHGQRLDRLYINSAIASRPKSSAIMEALQGQAAKRLQRLPGVFVEPHGPRATQSIDLAGISQHFCQLPWVATEDDYQKFCRCYGLVDVANAIAYHLPTVATHDPFIESAHSKSYGDHARYPEWELEVQQAGFDLSPARHHLVSRWSESDKDTFSLLVRLTAR